MYNLEQDIASTTNTKYDKHTLNVTCGIYSGVFRTLSFWLIRGRAPFSAHSWASSLLCSFNELPLLLIRICMQAHMQTRTKRNRHKPQQSVYAIQNLKTSRSQNLNDMCQCNKPINTSTLTIEIPKKTNVQEVLDSYADWHAAQSTQTMSLRF